MKEDASSEEMALQGGFHQLTNAVIMIVDDEPITMEVVQAFLEEAGYRKFILVENSSLAMQTIQENCPDILLLDLVMPEVSGFEILQRIREMKEFRHLPVIILTSLSDTESKLRALDMGATDFLAKPVDPSELRLRVRNTLAAKAYQDQLAYYDPLTNLPNRQLFLDRLDWMLKEATRYKESMALLNIELDNFDRISDSCGLQTSDEVLRIVAQRIEGAVRCVDLIGRLPGAESPVPSLFRLESSAFSLLLYRIQGVVSAAIVAERVLQVIREPIQAGDKNIYLTASIGIATYPAEGQDGLDLMRLASSAKGYARKNGGDSFQFASPFINEKYERRLSLESRLRGALEKNEFQVYYQPKVDVMTGGITGCEALARWIDSEKGFISPAEFIPLAEETGLIVPIGEWILNEACTQLAKWHAAGSASLDMAVNISIKQFNDPGFYDSVERILGDTGISIQHLTLEITESLLMEDIENKILSLQYLRDLGVKLSIDDFGTGYSSLAYLRRLPVNELKIDRAFVMEVSKNAASRAIVSSIIFLSHNLGLKTVAEGVETEEEMDFLRKKHCDQFQGFLFSKPIPAKEFFDLLMNGKARSQ